VLYILCLNSKEMAVSCPWRRLARIFLPRRYVGAHPEWWYVKDGL